MALTTIATAVALLSVVILAATPFVWATGRHPVGTPAR